MLKKEGTTNNSKKQNSQKKHSMFKCQLKIFIAVYIFTFSLLYLTSKTEDSVILFLSVIIQIAALILLSICTYKIIKIKNYSLIKKIGVWIWDTLMSIFLIGMANQLATKSFIGIQISIIQNTGLHCNSKDVKTLITKDMKHILIKNHLISIQDAKKIQIILSDIQELKKTKQRKLQTTKCKAKMQLNIKDNLFIYAIDYNATLDTRRNTINFYTTINSINNLME